VRCIAKKLLCSSSFGHHGNSHCQQEFSDSQEAGQIKGLQTGSLGTLFANKIYQSSSTNAQGDVKI